MSNYYQNKVALVTGAASGIGAAISKALIENGCKVYLADIDRKSLESEVEKLGDGAFKLVMDISNIEDFRAGVEQLISREGKIDLLFNNAGIGQFGEAIVYSAENWKRIIDVNIKGVINGVSIVYPIMVEQQFGQIVNTASLAGLVPSALLVPYATTKHAIVGLTRSLRLEAQEYGIKVNVLCPGTIDTKMLDVGSKTKNSIDSRSYLSKVTGKPISPDAFANKVLKGIKKDKELIFYPPKAKEIWKFSKLFPNQLSRLAIKAMRKEKNQ